MMEELNYEILNSDLNTDDTEVNILCITYNHEPYIATALEGFLMQKTSFKYKIYIHDDASTDKTAEIVREYAKKYPDKIVAVLQKENQHSKKVRITATFLLPLIKGKYCAFCEGDDFWTDENKLQKQYDYMESHPECAMCAHSGILVDAASQKPLGRIVYATTEHICSFEEIILGFGRIVLTNSFFYKADAIKKSDPLFRQISPCGDYTTPILCYESGTVAYLPEVMSAYRVSSNATSITTQMKTKAAYRKAYCDRFDAMLNALDDHTGYKYSDFINKERNRIWIDYFVQVGDKKTLKQEPYCSVIKGYSLKRKLIFNLDLHFPKFSKYLRNKKTERHLKNTAEIIDIKGDRSNKWFQI